MYLSRLVIISLVVLGIVACSTAFPLGHPLWRPQRYAPPVPRFGYPLSDPFHEDLIENAYHEMNKLTNALEKWRQESQDLMTRASSVERWTPVVDISETEDSIVIHAEIPGVDKDDLKIRVDKDVITLSGERESSEEKEEEKAGRKWHWQERSYGSFSRSFQLPENTDTGKIKASYKDGVLEVAIPKPEQTKSIAAEIPIEFELEQENEGLTVEEAD